MKELLLQRDRQRLVYMVRKIHEPHYGGNFHYFTFGEMLPQLGYQFITHPRRFASGLLGKTQGQLLSVREQPEIELRDAVQLFLRKADLVQHPAGMADTIGTAIGGRHLIGHHGLEFPVHRACAQHSVSQMGEG